MAPLNPLPHLFFFVLLLAPPFTSAQLGPGSGPWQQATPESQGLSSEDLDRAARDVESAMSGRVCYLVVKNGVVVKEEYYRGWNERSVQAGWSTTKSLCASLYGVAVQQGWASVDDRVADRNSNTRLCNRDATFKNVLTMTGESRDINNPRYSYDTLGTNCLDTLQDTIRQNNPDGLSSTPEWKDKYYQSVLGMEHLRWATGDLLQCGFSAQTGCRDLARAAQLWANEGVWEGHGQLMNKEYAQQGRSWVFPNSGNEYGYTLWLKTNDPVDPQQAHMNGMYAQCAYFSKEHNAVVVSMGNGGSCGNVWSNTRDAIVSNDHPLYNQTRGAHGNISPEQERAEMRFAREEAIGFRPYFLNNSHLVPRDDLKQYNSLLKSFGVDPVPLP